MKPWGFLVDGDNKKGGVVHDVGVLYLRDVILPCFPDIAADTRSPLCVMGTAVI